MKRLFTFALFFILLSAAAGVLPPQAHPVGGNDHKYTTLPDSCYYYLDMGDKHFTLKQIVANGNAELPSEEEGEFVFDVFGNGNYWMWYRLKNTSANAYIAAIKPSSGKADIYIYDQNKWHRYRSGEDVAWSDKNGDKNNNYIPYSIAAGHEIIVYVNETGRHEPPRVGNFVKIASEAYLSKNVYEKDHVIMFGFAGFILFGMIFNLLFYYVSREKLYLVYSMLLFFSVLTIGNDSIGRLYFAEHRDWLFYYSTLIQAGFIIMFIYTVRYFFSMRDYFPQWDTVFAYFTPVYIFFALFFSLIIYLSSGTEFFMYVVIMLGSILAFASFGAGLLFVAFVVLLIWTLVVFVRRKDPEARLFTIAIMPFFASYLINFFVEWEWLTLSAWMWTMIVLSWGLFARFKRLQEEYAAQALEKERLAREKEEEKNAIIAQQNILLEKLVDERTADLEKSLDELRQTQDQLIQSEKMASLGELTAGIAHEIQNPLNFVNNFSDVSIELLDEMEEELEKGDIEEVKAISGDIKQNLEKIAHHGRRADGIVKGMLQHSRTSSGQKEPADINGLADEYLRLAYHGLRAKDKSFNADLVTNFAEGLPKPNIIPQDVGRVLLNLFTNAFYATQEKGKQWSVASGQPQQESYKPKVEVTTKQEGNSIVIIVKDNGTGIPDAIKDKILQPFFTTKPTGQGTGLGLSLSYDIIVKGHAGSIDIKSTEGQGAEFVITLPLH